MKPGSRPTFRLFNGDYQAKDRYLAELDQVDADDLIRVARKYLVPENLTVGVILPEQDAKQLDQDRILSLLNNRTREDPSNTVHRFVLPNGATLLVKPDHTLPLVSFRAVFLGGVRFETPETSGLNNFLAEVWDKGTKKRSAADLAQAVEDMAGRLVSFSGRNSLGIEADFLSQYLDQGLELLAEVLLEPRLAQTEVDRARVNILAALQRQREQLLYRTFRLFAQTIYGRHPYALNTLGSEESVQAITMETLRDYYRKAVVPENMVMAVVGDVDPEKIRSKIQTLLEPWPPGDFVEPNIQPPAPLKELKAGSEALERAQAHLMLGFLVPGLESADRYALRVMEAVLSGQGGRLFTDLRDKQSLAYTVTSLYRPALGTGTFGFYIAFAPHKYDLVRSGLTRIIQDLTKTPISSEELTRAKENILGTYEIRLQRYGEQAGNLAFNERYGLGSNYREKIRSGDRRGHGRRCPQRGQTLP